jgi:two-component system OmpR family sensor kinase
MALTSSPPAFSPPALRERLARGWRHHRIEVGWWIFVGVNAWGILILREWATIPFHFIWIGLALIYGRRVWTLPGTCAALGVIILVTGLTLGADVASGDQAADELTEIPLMSAVFVVMVLYVRRSVAAQKQTERVSEHNLTLLEQGRRFVQDASHILRTPLTIALGYAEVLQRTTVDPDAAQDAQVVIDELIRLKKTTDRLLELAKSEQPDFLYPVETSVSGLVTSVASRWVGTHPAIGLGRVEEAVISVDPDRVAEALDEMISNAVLHTPDGTPIEISARHDGAHQVLSVSDSGPGVPDFLVPAIFDRFAHLPQTGSHRGGLGLAIVKAITEAHGGEVRVMNRREGGSTFEVWLPLMPAHLSASERDLDDSESPALPR